MIPLNQKVRVIFANSQGDEWGVPVKSSNSVTYKVRLDFNADAKILEGFSGDTALYSATIYFKGSVPITYDDFIEYDNGIDGLTADNPRVIFPITDLAGKVLYTKVIV